MGNAITRDRGDLVIAKTVSNPDGAVLPVSFEVGYDCGEGFTGTKSISVGSPATVTGIPTGNTCTVTETAPAGIAGFTWAAATYTPASQVMTTAGKTITVGNAITRDRGDLVISKTLLAGGSGYSAAFTIDYSCTFQELPVKVGTVTIASGQLATIGGIPTGSICIVTETLPSAVTGYTWSVPVIAGSPTLGITTDGSRTVAVTNQLTAIPVPPAPGPGPSAAVAVPPVGVVPPVPSATPTETPLPVNVVLPATGIVPNAVDAGDGSSRDSSSQPPWGLGLLMAGAIGISIVAIRRRTSGSD